MSHGESLSKATDKDRDHQQHRRGMLTCPRNRSPPCSKHSPPRSRNRSASEVEPGQFTVPGLCKITVLRKPATKERKGINPFTNEETTFAAKPARNVVKIRPLKGLKDMV